MMKLEQADLDELWLLDKCDAMRKRVSNEVVDTFCDRVWELYSTRNLPVNEARTKALSEVLS